MPEIEYKRNLYYAAVLFKILAVIIVLLTIFITIMTISFHGAGNMGQQAPGFLIFNTAFPVLLGIGVALGLYALSEFILLMLDLKEDLEQIKE